MFDVLFWAVFGLFTILAYGEISWRIELRRTQRAIDAAIRRYDEDQQ